MKLSENWLRERVELSADHDTLVERLNMIGHEVEDDTSLGAGLQGVVVARILACDKHPQADRLKVCRVDAGGETMQIVCGAPNARAGLIAPLAKIGATLPGGLAIKAAQLRGVESAGMLCSARELGIDADASGLMELPDDAPIGAPLAEYLGLPDHVLDLGLTPNRADCLAMIGLASDIAAAFGTRAHPLKIEAIAPQGDRRVAIEVAAPADCPRYCGRYIEGIDASARTPEWMAQRLRRGGIRPIGLLVDVTQYVMLELGQPMHAFEAAKLEGSIGVRRARADETLKLLDEREVKLDPEFLVITDAGRPVALAGVMGGFDTRVTAGTRDVFLEAAHFSTASIAGRARKLNMSTDAAHRFERGVDPELPRLALERAAALILQAAGGRPGPIVEAASPQHLPKRASIVLRRARIARVLGIDIADDEVARILPALDMRIETHPDGWRVLPPSRRFDIEREEDLIEEVARIHGYDKIPSRLPAGEPPAPKDDETRLPASALGAQLAARDFHEAICYAFVDASLLKTWQMDARAVPLDNPLSAELGVMRTSLLPGLVAALQGNLRRQQSRVRLFESGRVFACGDDGAPIETAMVAAVVSGAARAEQWGERSREADFFDFKGDLESLLAMSGDAGAWGFDREALPPWLHPGRGARVLRDGRPAGFLGVLHPRLSRALDLDEDVHAFEVRIEALAARPLPRGHGLPRFPSVRRDIAVELPRTVAWDEVEATLRQALGAVLAAVFVFDVYTGKNLKEGEKSLAMGLILQDASRTLTDEDADRGVAAAVGALEAAFGARLRS